MYNEELSNQLREAYLRSGVGLTVIAELMDLPYRTAQKYITKERAIKRSDIERKAIVTIAILNEMCDNNLLPISGSKNSSQRVKRIIAEIEKFIESK